MDLLEFKQSLSGQKPPAPASVYLTALWHDAIGNWEKAHKLIQDIEDKNAAWIHAYLHRKEGDSFNADYWYNKAHKRRPDSSLQDEWESLVNEFL